LTISIEEGNKIRFSTPCLQESKPNGYFRLPNLFLCISAPVDTATSLKEKDRHVPDTLQENELDMLSLQHRKI